jgi:arylsulfatase A-like enzyme
MTQFEGGLHVPFILKWPARLPASEDPITRRCITWT